MPDYHPVIPTAEPFLFPGDNIGILLVHGFTGAPKEMRTMGEYFASQGHTVLGIRLPGHATHPQDLPRMHWTDWFQAVEDGYHLLHSAGCQVFIMGLSLGGLLTLTAAARWPIAGAVAMSTPHHLPPDPRLPFVKYLAPLVRTAPKGPSDWQDPSMYQGHVEYPQFPTRGVAELRDLISEMHRSLAQIRCPVLLVHSRTDGAVSPDNVERIYAELGTSDKAILWLDKSGHVVTRDLERQRVFEAAESFVRRISVK
jgi:carboxylesterase